MCPECSEKREVEIGLEQEEERKQKESEDLKRRGIRGRMLDMTLDTYEITTNEQNAAFTKCAEYARDLDGNLLLIGSVGTGKTHLGVAIARSNDRGEYTTLMRMIRDIRRSYSKDEHVSEQGIIDKWASRRLLVIDEIGVQHATNAEQLLVYEVINDRYIQNLPTVLISNETVEGMTEILGERVMDRLAENGRVVAFTWDSYRRRDISRET
jgi:DNA replication protein DnaC